MGETQQPHLPLGLSPSVALSVNGAKMISSGVVVARPKWTIDLAIADLKFLIRFDDEAPEGPKLSLDRPDEKSLTITLKKFTNSLGTAIGPIDIAIVADKKIWLALYVEALPDIKALSYSIYWGGDLG